MRSLLAIKIELVDKFTVHIHVSKIKLYKITLSKNTFINISNKISSLIIILKKFSKYFTKISQF